MQIIKKIIIKTIIRKAAEFEKRAYRFYDQALGRKNNPLNQELLKKLRDAELKHIIRLLEAEKRWFESGRLDLGIDEENIKEKFPEIHVSNLIPEEKKKSDIIPPEVNTIDILLIALRKEKKSYSYYKRLSKRKRFNYIHDLFSFLADEEESHIRWITGEIKKTKNLK